jgi:hypothetical protein
VTDALYVIGKLNFRLSELVDNIERGADDRSAEEIKENIKNKLNELSEE